MTGSSKPDYKKTLRACYLGFITQAIAANFAPLIFLKLHNDYQIPLGMIALIPTAFFFTQLIVDIFCAKFVDKIGYRVSIVASEIFSAVGLVALAFLPDLLPSAFAGIMISVVLYAVGSGLIEVLCSPIVEACPFENKEKTMSLLHSFYCWGWLGVTVISSLLFTTFGIDNWKYVACFWALIPLYNIYNFATCPIEKLVDSDKGMTILQLFKSPLFWVAVVLMVCSGASELSMAQWASAFVESGLGLSKTVCDLAGPCLFAVTMGICRVFYGKFGDKVELTKFMIGSGLLCLICYIMASLSHNAVVALAGCVLCGFSVGIMWPGTLSISSKKIPRGGTALFALLAMAGDLGGSIGPSAVGMISQKAGDNLQQGLFFGGIFPVLLVIFLILLKFMKDADSQEEQLSLGKSGAELCLLEDDKVLKTAVKTKLLEKENGSAVWESCLKEAKFYKETMDAHHAFLPQIFHCDFDEENVRIIMGRYAAIKKEDLSDDDFDEIMKLLAQVHELAVPDFLKNEKQGPLEISEEEIKNCLAGWKSIFDEHSGETSDVLDFSKIQKLADCINQLNKKTYSECACLCHGDFHAENILRDEKSGQLILCDWQSVSLCHPAVDIAFFMSRLQGDGIAFDENKIIDTYCSHAKSGITKDEIKKQMALANINTTFRYWHYYLHGSPKELVEGIVEKMVIAQAGLI